MNKAIFWQITIKIHKIKNAMYIFHLVKKSSFSHKLRGDTTVSRGGGISFPKSHLGGASKIVQKGCKWNKCEGLKQLNDIGGICLDRYEYAPASFPS